jgi:hypothetical protein
MCIKRGSKTNQLASLMGIVQDYKGLLAARWFLGVTEVSTRHMALMRMQSI